MRNIFFVSLYTTSEGIDVGYESLWSHHWEPFFVSPQTAPDYDERFKQVFETVDISLGRPVAIIFRFLELAFFTLAILYIIASVLLHFSLVLIG